MRFKQELILGIGGWRLLAALGMEPEICHLNEGHAAFAILERAADYMKKTQQPFDVALAATRAGNLFTTHTAVSAGFDQFPPELMAKFLEKYAKTQLGLSFDKFLALGQLPGNDNFNMAYLAIRGSGYVNGVSKLHGEVSRQLFDDLFNRWPEKEIPVGYVTNGVHMPTWDSCVSDELWTKACGKNRWLEPTEKLEKQMRALSDQAIWTMRNQSRASLIDYARARLARQLGARGSSEDEVASAKSSFKPNALTLGFARRFAAYKRPDLLLTDENRLINILTNPDRPVQLIIAGKAHPADGEGHSLIKKWMDFIARPEVRPHVIFLTDDDMILTAYLVQGVDLWINTPRRPWEACGTSGMKILVNGGLNLSELDGWWAEAYSPEVGWALGDLKEHGNDPNWDRIEANKLYDLLEKEIIPDFYNREGGGIPTAWLGKIRESMARLTPYYSSNRAVREYTERFYLPGAAAYRKRIENNSALAEKIVAWQLLLKENWSKLAFGEVKVEAINDNYVFEIQVFLDNIDPHYVKVQLYSDQLIKDMDGQGTIYRAEIPVSYQPSAFTPRIIPNFPEVAVPLEASQILWQK